MEKSLVNRGIRFFWTIFQYNVFFFAANAVLVFSFFAFLLHWLTLPFYMLGIFLLFPALQALFLSMKRREQWIDTTPFKMYLRCYKEEFYGALKLALSYVFAVLLLGGSYAAIGYVPGEFAFIPLYALLAIILFIHLIFALLIRSNFEINLVGTWRLGFYCISRYPLKAFFLLGGTLVAVGVSNTFNQLIVLGILPAMVCLATIFTETMFNDIRITLNIPISQSYEKFGKTDSASKS